jgi:hypothetical protein
MSYMTSFEAIGFERGRAIGLRLSIPPYCASGSVPNALHR